MKIQSSIINMEASHHKQAMLHEQETLKVWKDGEQQATAVDVSEDLIEDISETNLKSFELKADPNELNKIIVVQRMLERLTGKKMKFLVPQRIILSQQSIDMQVKQPQNKKRFGWGIIYNKMSEYSEHEALDFSANGKVVTEDGKTIDVSLSMSMSRSFMSRESLTVTAGDALVDPLVINFGAGAAGLTQQKYEFDIDCDGNSDLISFVRSGSGFLAYDKNNDGIINNGSELFGPSTGNGFLELAEFDSDGNGWIDENDDIYDKLRIWCKDEEGEDKLFAIGQKGIGAIYLSNIDTQFSLTNTSNELLGQVQKTSIYLSEDGKAGTIQHVDLSL